MQRVFNISGGRTSAYMVIKYWKEGDIVIFCDTTREHPKTYKFLNDFEAHENIPIVRLKFEGGWKGFLQKWNNGKNIPNRTQRECTFQMKIKTARRYLRSLDFMSYENFIGFRADEPLRVKRHREKWQQVKTIFPLYDDGITKPVIIDFFSKKPYDLEIPAILGNCDLCFMKGQNAVMAILAQYPELADKWIEDEESPTNIYKHSYFQNITMRKLRDISQNNLFKDYNLDLVKPALNCACTS
jgi:hypothetical protein